MKKAKGNGKDTRTLTKKEEAAYLLAGVRKIQELLLITAEKAHTAKSARTRKKNLDSFRAVAAHNPDVTCKLMARLWETVQHAEAVDLVKRDLDSRGLKVFKRGDAGFEEAQAAAAAQRAAAQ